MFERTAGAARLAPFILLGTVFAIATGLLWRQQSLKHENTEPMSKLSSAMVLKRVNALSKENWGPTMLCGEPLLLTKTPCSVIYGPKPRRMWYVNCRSQNVIFDFVYDDATGQLCMLTGSVLSRTAPEDGPIATSYQAASTSADRLRSLYVFDSAAKVTLLAKPTLTRAGSAWRCVWQVKPANRVKPYDLGMVLDRISGAPLLVTYSRDIT